MVEYAAMRDAGFKNIAEHGMKSIPSGYSNRIMSGYSTYYAASNIKKAQADKLAIKLKSQFELNKIAKSVGCKI